MSKQENNTTAMPKYDFGDIVALSEFGIKTGEIYARTKTPPWRYDIKELGARARVGIRLKNVPEDAIAFTNEEKTSQMEYEDKYEIQHFLEYEDKYEIQLLLEPQLNQAEEEFLDVAGKGSVIETIDDYEEGVRRARAFDAYTSEVYKRVKEWAREQKHGFHAIKTAINSWLEEARGDAIRGQSIHLDDYSKGGRIGRSNAIEALIEARDRLEELDPKNEQGLRGTRLP